MSGFSTEARKIFDAMYFSGSSKVIELIQDLKQPLDILFAKFCLASLEDRIEDPTNFLNILSEIRDENNALNDNLISFLTNFLQYDYHNRSLHFDSIKTKNSFKKLKISYKKIALSDDWAGDYFTALYYHSRAEQENNDQDFSSAINSQFKCIDNYAKIPNGGDYFAALEYNFLGILHLMVGNFIEAENSFLHCIEVVNSSNIKNEIHVFDPIGNLAWISSLKGDLKAATIYLRQRIEMAKSSQNPESIRFIGTDLSRIANFLMKQGDYDNSLQAHEESLEFQKKQNTPYSVFMGYFQIFMFYFARFRAEGNQSFLSCAKDIVAKLEAFSMGLGQTKSVHQFIQNYTKYAQGLILRYGNIKKKAKAMEIFEELIETYPENLEMHLHLAELLFEDAVISDDEDTINQIDEIVEKIKNIPLRENNYAVDGFIIQQLIIAKYHFYVKSRPSDAIELLEKAKEKIFNYGLQNFITIIDREIEAMEKEITKWDTVPKSMKKKIQLSGIDKFIEEALKIVEQEKKLE